jgi:hypothetical protein
MSIVILFDLAVGYWKATIVAFGLKPAFLLVTEKAALAAFILCFALREHAA